MPAGRARARRSYLCVGCVINAAWCVLFRLQAHPGDHGAAGQDHLPGGATYSNFIFLETDRCSILFRRPTQATTELLDKIIYRVETENGWDQALFNECIFFPSRPGYKVCRAVLRRLLGTLVLHAARRVSAIVLPFGGLVMWGAALLPP